MSHFESCGPIIKRRTRFHVTRTFTDSCQGCPRIVPAISILGSTERKKAGMMTWLELNRHRENERANHPERDECRSVPLPPLPSSRFQIPFLIRVLCHRIYAHFDIRIGLKERRPGPACSDLTKTLPHSVFRACHPFVSIV